MNINQSKLRRMVARGEDLGAMHFGALRNSQDQSKRCLDMRDDINNGTQEYQKFVAGLSIDQLLRLTPEQQTGFKVTRNDVHALIDATARADAAKKRAVQAAADSSAFSMLVINLKAYAATHGDKA